MDNSVQNQGDQVVADLKQIHELINARGWIRDSYGSEERGYCLVGAALHVVFGSYMHSLLKEPQALVDRYLATLDALANALMPAQMAKALTADDFGDEGGTSDEMVLYAYNDNVAANKDSALGLVKRAIRNAGGTP